MNVSLEKVGYWHFSQERDRPELHKCLFRTRDRQGLCICPFLWTWRIIWEARRRVRAGVGGGGLNHSVHGSQTKQACGHSSESRAEGAELHSLGFAVCQGQLFGKATRSHTWTWKAVGLAATREQDQPIVRPVSSFVCTGSCHKGIAVCDSQVALNSITRLTQPYLFTREDVA